MSERVWCDPCGRWHDPPTSIEHPARAAMEDSVGRTLSRMGIGDDDIEALARQARELGVRDEFDESTCDRCGRDNPVWWTPAETWQAVYGEGGQPTRQGVLCPSCFIDDARRNWRFSSSAQAVGSVWMVDVRRPGIE